MESLESGPLELIADDRDFAREAPSVFPETGNGKQEVLVRV